MLLAQAFSEVNADIAHGPAEAAEGCSGERPAHEDGDGRTSPGYQLLVSCMLHDWMDDDCRGTF